jgi:hypothetical protein
MATVAQIAANRLNAQKSTGPRSVDGKLASSMNALKHGIDAASVLIPGEDPALYERIAADYRSQIDPEGVLEEYQVETLIDSDWQRRRLKRVHAGLYRQLLAEGLTPEAVDVTVLRDSATGKLLLRVWRQMASLERAHKSALAEIRRLRRERARLEAEEIQLRLDAPLPAPEGAFAAACEKFRERNEPNSPSQPTSQPPAGQAPAAPPPPARPLAG